MVKRKRQTSVVEKTTLRNLRLSSASSHVLKLFVKSKND